MDDKFYWTQPDRYHRPLVFSKDKETNLTANEIVELLNFYHNELLDTKEKYFKTLDKQITSHLLFFEGLERFYDLGAMINEVSQDERCQTCRMFIYDKYYHNCFAAFKKLVAFEKHDDPDYYEKKGW